MRWTLLILFSLSTTGSAHFSLLAEEEPLNPFGNVRGKRTDAVPGAMLLSDGKILKGNFYLTRDHNLKIYDETKERIREVPLNAVREIECSVKKEWMEKEWRFKENANNEKIYTGRTYPSRIYVHELKLKRGDSIQGPLAALIYFEPAPPNNEPENEQPGAIADTPPGPVRYLLHKRDKGKPGEELKDLIYVKRIVLGRDAEMSPPEIRESTEQQRATHKREESRSR